jgi:hypothetical protein
MQRSQELLEAYTRMMEDFQDGRITTIHEVTSDSEAVSAFGSAGTEWARREHLAPWMDPMWAAFRRLGMVVDTSRAEAWAEGDFGFVVDTPPLTLAEGQSVQLRWTGIFRKEGGAWKIVHQHGSFAAPSDVETIKGFEEALLGVMAQV